MNKEPVRIFNEASNTVNVMYRLDKGGYGLLVPELE
jgi:hypothetical protein